VEEDLRRCRQKETMSFEYVECNRKDVGLNVRKKAETVQPSQGEGCCYEG